MKQVGGTEQKVVAWEQQRAAAVGALTQKKGASLVAESAQQRKMWNAVLMLADSHSLEVSTLKCSWQWLVRHVSRHLVVRTSEFLQSLK